MIFSSNHESHSRNHQTASVNQTAPNAVESHQIAGINVDVINDHIVVKIPITVETAGTTDDKTKTNHEIAVTAIKMFDASSGFASTRSTILSTTGWIFSSNFSKTGNIAVQILVHISVNEFFNSDILSCMVCAGSPNLSSAFCHSSKVAFTNACFFSASVNWSTVFQSDCAYFSCASVWFTTIQRLSRIIADHLQSHVTMSSNDFVTSCHICCQ